MLDHDADGVHGDHGEHRPEPQLRLAHLADADARPPHLQAPVALRAWKKKRQSCKSVAHCGWEGVLQRKSDSLGSIGSVGITMLCHVSLQVATFVIF